MNCQSECPVHLPSHIGHFASVGAIICQLETKETITASDRLHFEYRQQHSNIILNIKLDYSSRPIQAKFSHIQGYNLY